MRIRDIMALAEESISGDNLHGERIDSHSSRSGTERVMEAALFEAFPPKKQPAPNAGDGADGDGERGAGSQGGAGTGGMNLRGLARLGERNPSPQVDGTQDTSGVGEVGKMQGSLADNGNPGKAGTAQNGGNASVGGTDGSKGGETKDGEKEKPSWIVTVELPVEWETDLLAAIPVALRMEIEKPEYKPHVTVLYMGREVDGEAIEGAFSEVCQMVSGGGVESGMVVEVPAPSIEIVDVVAFPVSPSSDGKTPIVALVRSEHLHVLNAALLRGFNGSFRQKQFITYRPHITIGYLPRVATDADRALLSGITKRVPRVLTGTISPGGASPFAGMVKGYSVVLTAGKTERKRFTFAYTGPR